MTEAKAVPAPRKRAPAIKRKKKPAAWTADKKTIFLAKLAATANVSASARACRMSESAVYRLRQRSAEFRAAWQAALREGYARPVSLRARRLGTTTLLWLKRPTARPRQRHSRSRLSN